ncbi:MAG: GTP cyclohydrolase [Solirubrobacteraceae bacterium]
MSFALPAEIRTQVSLPLRFADGYATAARVFSFDGLVDGQEHLAFGLGDRAAGVTSADSGAVPLVRPHSECLTGDVFGSQRCDCGAQLREAVERIAEDERSYLVAAQMLRTLGVTRAALLTNNPDKASQLRRFGLTVTACVPTGVHLSATNARYLATKARRGAHALDLPLSAG